MRNLYLACLCLIGGYCYCQQPIDSLQHLLRKSLLEKKEEDISYYYSSIGAEYLKANQYDSALLYLQKSLPHTTDDHLDLKASTLNGMGVAHNNKGNTDSSIFYYKQALHIYKLLSDEDNITNLETNLAIIYKNKGLFEEALETAFSAIAKFEKKKEQKTLSSCYSTVASVYGNIREYDLAIQFHRKALALRLLLDYKKGIGQSYNNLGEIFLKTGQYDSALHHLQLALDIKTKNGEQAPATLNNLGEVMFKTQHASEAQQYVEQALAIYVKLGDLIGQVTSLLQLGEVSLSKGLTSQAEVQLNQAEKLARQSGSLYALKQVLEKKIKLYRGKNDFNKAFLSSRELLEVKDSLLNREKAEALSNLQIRYETDKKEQQIRLLQNEKDIQEIQLLSNTRWVRSLIIVAVLLIIILALTFFLYRSSQRNKARVELLLKELNHRVKNNLQILSSLLSLQSSYLKDTPALEAVKSNEGRVNAMALIHKKLYLHEATQEINMKEYIEELVQYLTHSYGYSEQNLSLSLQVDAITLNVDKAIPIGLIINELVTNAFKYAFPSQPHPSLKLTFHQSRQAGIIEIADNGKGATTPAPAAESFGLKMVNMLIKELKAEIKRVQGPGTSFIITLPIT
jgi:two-component sensor histidine kinase/tetratricopeptide (TPR) repeat protein